MRSLVEVAVICTDNSTLLQLEHSGSNIFPNDWVTKSVETVVELGL